MGIKDYKELNIWQKGITLVEWIYKITNKFPADEQYGLVAQIRRSAVSVPSNIAEGFARQHNKEYKQFLYIALGSCAEIDTQIIIAKKLKYLNDDEYYEVVKEITALSKMIMSLIKKLN